MAIVKNGYITRKIHGVQGHHGDRPGSKVYRNWYFAKPAISMGTVHIPRQYWGKHIRFKIEVEHDE